MGTFRINTETDTLKNECKITIKCDQHFQDELVEQLKTIFEKEMDKSVIVLKGKYSIIQFISSNFEKYSRLVIGMAKANNRQKIMQQKDLKEYVAKNKN